MSLKKVRQVRKDRFFKIWDILIYGLIAAVVAALFIAAALTADNSALQSVEVRYNNALAFFYDFSADEYEISLPQNIAVEENEDGLTVTFCTDGGSLAEPRDYNIIFIDKSARTVSVTESDCSNRKDCVHTRAITNSSGVIACTPHRLEISPPGFSDIDGTLPAG